MSTSRLSAVLVVSVLLGISALATGCSTSAVPGTTPTVAPPTPIVAPTTATVAPTTTTVAPTTTTVAPTTTTLAPTTTTQAPKWNTILNQQGSGQASFQAFTIGSNAQEWALAWAYNCSGFGSSGNFIVDINLLGGGFTSDAGPNELGMSGNSVDYYYDQGTFQLQVNSECNWGVRVQAIS